MFGGTNACLQYVSDGWQCAYTREDIDADCWWEYQVYMHITNICMIQGSVLLLTSTISLVAKIKEDVSGSHQAYI